jgi:hypothetical protein
LTNPQNRHNLLAAETDLADRLERSPFCSTQVRPASCVRTREALDTRVQLSWHAHYSGKHQDSACGTRAEGLTHIRWHDMRYTEASWHVPNGTPLFALQELGGWESRDMVRRYPHLAADHLGPLRNASVPNAPSSRKTTAQMRHIPEEP